MRSLRIAVADDEPDMRDYYARILPRLGHTVVAVAATGQALLEQCQALRPDLVITDVRMPDLDGFEAAVRLCQDAPVPVILVTAYRDPDKLRRADGDPVMAYLVKPVRQADLQPTIHEALRRFEQIHARPDSCVE
jgi:response regulator NasT